MAKKLTRREVLQASGILAGGAAVSGVFLANGQVFAKLSSESDADPWEEAAGILRRVKPPEFREQRFVITDYGAVGDGTTDCTNAFRNTIAACAADGGGHVVVPSGTFLTGAIHLQSNVDLNVTSGATIKFSQDPAQYLPVVYTRWQGIELYNYSPFIYAYGQENVGISGEGTLDGQADNGHWWPWAGKTQFGWQPGQPNQNADFTALEQMATNGVSVEQRIFGAGHYLRPTLVEFYKCQNVVIEGITITNSPFWEMHPTLSENVTVQNVSVSSLGPNNDGCDPESCSYVVIQRCTFNTGDDCIAIKSGRNVDGRRVNVPCENVLIQNCAFQDGHGGVTVGSEMSGGVRKVFARNLTMTSPNLQTCLRVKSNSQRGGFVEDIYLANTNVTQLSEAGVLLTMLYDVGEGYGYNPIIQNIGVKNLTVGQTKYALEFQGYSDDPIQHVLLTNCTFSSATRPNIVQNVNDLQLKNVTINGTPVG